MLVIASALYKYVLKRMKSCMESEAFIRYVKLKNDVVDPSIYPFNIPAIKSIASLDFSGPITFLIGENGSGKSTIVEGIALAAGFNAEGGTKNYSFETKDTSSSLSDHLTLVRGSRREKAGFFLRAESFYNVSTETERLGLKYGDVALHAQSHGESFLDIVVNRFEGNGLYLLDEPEAALSPQNQLALMYAIRNLIEQGSQFIIATHSPILLAFPDAAIYQLGQRGCEKISYEDTPVFRMTRDFLLNHGRYMEKLLES